MPVPRRRRKAKDAAEPSEEELTQKDAPEVEAGAAEPEQAAAGADGEAGEAEPADVGAVAEAPEPAEAEAPEPAEAEAPEPAEAEATEPAEAEAEASDAAEAAADAEDESPQAEAGDDAAEPEEKPGPPRRRGAAETTTRTEPTRPAPRRESDGAVQVRAQAKYVRSAPRKARLVMDHIRGKDVKDARAILRHTPRAAASDIAKLLDSAVANAENNFELDPEDLKIDRAFVDEGPTIKRYRPRALGRATRINKRTSHMTITLTMRTGAGEAGGGRR